MIKQGDTARAARSHHVFHRSLLPAGHGDEDRDVNYMAPPSARLVAWEHAPSTTFAAILADHGILLSPAAHLNDRELTRRLWEIVRVLSLYDVHLRHTNHLSDRELYELLVERLLWQQTKNMPPGSGWYVELDVLAESADGAQAYRAHYASDVERQLWFADEPVQAGVSRECSEKLPYDRDRFLP